MQKHDGESTYIQSTRGDKFQWCITVRRDFHGRTHINAVEGEETNDGHFFQVSYGNGANASRNVRIETPEVKRITDKARANGLERMTVELRRLGYIA